MLMCLMSVRLSTIALFPAHAVVLGRSRDQPSGCDKRDDCQSQTDNDRRLFNVSSLPMAVCNDDVGCLPRAHDDGWCIQLHRRSQ